MSKRVPWTRDELLVAFRFYCRTPFGRLHRQNPGIVDLANLLDRTPSAVAMKACNFASLDPVHRARHVSGLGNASRADRELWAQFQENPEAIAVEAEATYARLTGQDPVIADASPDMAIPEGPTEKRQIIMARRVQAFFRSAVLAGYECCCALSDISMPDLLTASHIIPWKANTRRRADPTNGIALNALYDRAFDRGLITLDESYRVVLSPRLGSRDGAGLHRHALLDLEGRMLRLPSRFAPDPVALAYHRDHVFR